jgi:hypothetical protein
LAFVVRDEFWGTVSLVQTAPPTVAADADHIEVGVQGTIGGCLAIALQISIHREAEAGAVQITCEATIEAKDDYVTARAGFDFLHPSTLAGR